MPEFHSRWLEPGTKADGTPAPNMAEGTSVSFVSGGVDRVAPNGREVSADYLATVRALLTRWHALGRPALLLPRRRLPGQTVRPAPYVEPDLADFFLHSLADLPQVGWGPHDQETLRNVSGALGLCSVCQLELRDGWCPICKRTYLLESGDLLDEGSTRSGVADRDLDERT